MMLAALLFCSLDLRLPAGPVRKPQQVQTIVLHHTAVPTIGNSIRTLRLRGMSYHYIIDEQGLIIRTVPFGRTAFHAAGANRTSIGIAFVGGATIAWAPTEQQRTAAKQLIATLVRQHPRLQYVVGHGDIRDTNAGEPYGVSFESLIAELQAEAHIALRHLSKDEEPLLAYRDAAIELFANPRTPRTPSPTRQWPDHESVTCPGGKHIDFPVAR
jgi:N-acetylmuramoyl-L-alanine amidase